MQICGESKTPHLGEKNKEASKRDGYYMKGGSVMNNFDCTIGKMLLNVASSAIIMAVLIKVASAYRYVQVFV